MKRAVLLVGVLALSVLPQIAMAHPTTSFDICTITADECFTRGAAFIYGDTVRIRGHVAPAHQSADARVLRRDPHSSQWHRVATVTVGTEGTMRFKWVTRRADAVQDAPYSFRFRIAGHGLSNRTEAFVLFGE